MTTMRIAEFSRTYGVEVEDLLDKCDELGIDATTAQSSLGDRDLELLRAVYKKKAPAPEPKRAEPTEREKKDGKKVIRRKATKVEAGPAEAAVEALPAPEPREVVTEVAPPPPPPEPEPVPTPEVTAPIAAQAPEPVVAEPAAVPPAPVVEARAPQAPEAVPTPPPAPAPAAQPAAPPPAPAAAAAAPAPAAPAAAGAGAGVRILRRVDFQAVQQRHADLEAQRQAARAAQEAAQREAARPRPGFTPAPAGQPGEAPSDGAPGRRKVDFRKRRLEKRSEIDARREQMLRFAPRKKKGGKKAGQATQITTPKASKLVVRMGESITVADLAKRIAVKASDLIRKLMEMGQMVTVNESLDPDTAAIVAAEFGYEVEKVSLQLEDLVDRVDDTAEDMLPRPPVVTVMGHVDHGKTSLLDTIRSANVARGEAGGITQHIGAYQVVARDRPITFLDTPGHEAFTAMRARGANVTDIVILVVAANDGVMPQTLEALAHAKAAEVPIVVAVNKMDLPDANPDKVLQQLSANGIVPEDWGGDTPCVRVSAKTGQGVDDLLEIVLLTADVLELTANPAKPARGVVVEAKLTRGRGPVATVLVNEGTLKVGDSFITGKQYGKVRALMNERGALVREATPAMPVEVLGLSGVPQAGDSFLVVKDDAKMKQFIDELVRKQRESAVQAPQKMSLEQFYEKMAAGEAKELRVVLKADTQGSIEAVTSALTKLTTAKVEVKVLHGGVGAIAESDVMLASASNAIIVGFHVRPEVNARILAEKEGVDVRCYSIIYELLDEMQKAMTGLLEPEFREQVVGRAEIREIFSIPKVGVVGGCLVTHGTVSRPARARLLRDSVVVHDGKLGSLRRFKDDVREVKEGLECGLSFDGFSDIKQGDVVESYILEEVRPSLG
ncbi:MAG: translation initiation factor IF-2 [bacterium]